MSHFRLEFNQYQPNPLIFRLFISLFSFISLIFPYSIDRRRNTPSDTKSPLLYSRCSSLVPPKPQKIVGKCCQKKMYFIGYLPHISCPRPVKMKAENAKNLLHLPPHLPKAHVSPLLRRTKLSVLGCLGKNPINYPFAPILLLEIFRVVSFVGQDNLLLSGKKFIKDLGS